jgi:hypothetical protein
LTSAGTIESIQAISTVFGINENTCGNCWHPFYVLDPLVLCGHPFSGVVRVNIGFFEQELAHATSATSPLPLVGDFALLSPLCQLPGRNPDTFRCLLERKPPGDFSIALFVHLNAPLADRRRANIFPDIFGITSRLLRPDRSSFRRFGRLSQKKESISSL